jgi:rRNA-processing protein FCF1
MRDKVFLDTNLINNKEINNFLGGREALDKLSKVADILIPAIVLDEIKQHKNKWISDKVAALKENPIFKLLKYQLNRATSLKVETVVSRLERDEAIKFSRVELSNSNILLDIANLAVNHLPPFEQGSDKGFKDAIIYFTILQYVEAHPSETVNVITNDEMLLRALRSHRQIQVFSDFREYRPVYFYGEYFIERLRDEIGEPSITKESISEISFEKDGLWRIDVVCDSGNYIVIADANSKEIVSIDERTE